MPRLNDNRNPKHRNKGIGPVGTQSAPLSSVSARGVFYERRGSGRPVVFLHGWCLNRQMWTYAEEALAADYDIITPDMAGFGKSSHLPGPYGFARHAGDICALLVELDLHDAVLVGFAFGAAVALSAAGQDASRIAGVVSVAIPSATASPYDKMPKAMRRDWPGFARKSAEVLFHNPQSEATVGWLERMFGGTGLTVAIAACEALAGIEPEKLAAAAPVPQVYIHSEKDGVAPVTLGEACAATAQDAKLEIVANCGHLIVLDDKPAFHTLLQAWLNRLPAHAGG